MRFIIVPNLSETSKGDAKVPRPMRRQHRAQRKAFDKSRADKSGESQMAHYRKSYASHRKMKGSNVDQMKGVAKYNFLVARSNAKLGKKRKLP
jgi:hypothetical protein